MFRPSKPSELELKEQRRRSKEIDRQIRQEAKERRRLGPELNVAVFGTSGSGKSTFVNMTRMFLSSGLSKFERDSLRSTVYENVMKIVWSVLDALEAADYAFVLEEAEHARRLRAVKIGRNDGPCPLPPIDLKWVERWSRDQNVQRWFDRRGKLWVANFFLENLERFTEYDYVPTNEDVLHCHCPSKGFDESQFRLNPAERSIHLWEVGQFQTDSAQSNKRFSEIIRAVDVAIVVIAIDEYDKSSPPLQEGIVYLRSVAGLALLERTPMIICLSKCDAFAEKLKTSPLAQSFPQYQGPASDPNEAVGFLKRLLQEEVSKSQTAPRKLEIYQTSPNAKDELERIWSFVVNPGLPRA